METVKRILTKEKIDRQLAVQSTSIAFMIIKDITGCSKKTVLFDNQSYLDSKIDRLTAMMSKLTKQSSKQGKPFKHKIY